MVKDKYGYERKHSNLWSRKIAYHKLYLKHRGDFPLPFGEYEVHHIDGDKTNNKLENLAILTPEQHIDIHLLVPKIMEDSVSYEKLGDSSPCFYEAYEKIRKRHNLKEYDEDGEVIGDDEDKKDLFGENEDEDWEEAGHEEYEGVEEDDDELVGVREEDIMNYYTYEEKKEEALKIFNNKEISEEEREELVKEYREKYGDDVYDKFKLLDWKFRRKKKKGFLRTWMDKSFL